MKAIDLPSEIGKAIDAHTDLRVKAISWDLEIVLDILKYSNWQTAIATGGLALVVARADTGILSVIFFALAIGAGALTHQSCNLNIQKKRLATTIYYKQRALLFCGLSSLEDNDDASFYEKLDSGHYLDEPSKLALKKILDSPRYQPKFAQKATFAQLFLIMAGFVAIYIKIH